MAQSGSELTPTARDLLALERRDAGHFRALHNLDNLTGVTFGGQALGQSLAAARREAPDWPASSLAGVFLRGGDPSLPIDYAVEALSDGRRFSSRRVTALQDGRRIFECLCSFHDPEPGVSHQFPPAPDAPTARLPSPETLSSLPALVERAGGAVPARMAAIFARSFPIEIRPVDPDTIFTPGGSNRRSFWVRMPSAAGIEDAGDHQALLALMSDYWLPGTIAAPYQPERSLRGIASLNHSLWLHAPARADDWLLFRTESHWAAHGRGLSQGTLFDRDGRMVATVTQEASLRWVEPPG